MPNLIDLKLHKKSKQLELSYDDNSSFQLSCEFLRVHSPSAEVRGHGVGQETLQYGKKEVGISAIEPTGNYGVKLVFDDGHDSGIFSWEYLRELGENQESLWEAYLDKLHTEGKSRNPDSSVVRFVPLKKD